MKVLVVLSLLIPTLLLCPSLPAQTPPLTEREKFLLEKIAALEQRLSVLEQKLAVAPSPAPAPPPEPARAPPPPRTTLNVHFDGYYAWNTNRPLPRTNLVRGYDRAANNLSINQTGLVIERATSSAPGRRLGYRLDLMFGQATETLQGSPANEPRPHVYRHIFQAYGTAVAPVGKGLTLDFGKWASALGAEGNYTKDQINYSRSYFFVFLPFHHTGLRATYPVNEKLSLTYWLVNGANQTEDVNGFKSQLVQAALRPHRTLTWTLNYYNGREQRDRSPQLPAPRGRFHALDTYAFWTPNSRLTLGGEFAYVVDRVHPSGPPRHVTGGAAYLRYQLAPPVLLRTTLRPPRRRIRPLQRRLPEPQRRHIHPRLPPRRGLRKPPRIPPRLLRRSLLPPPRPGPSLHPPGHPNPGPPLVVRRQIRLLVATAWLPAGKRPHTATLTAKYPAISRSGS